MDHSLSDRSSRNSLVDSGCLNSAVSQMSTVESAGGALAWRESKVTDVVAALVEAFLEVIM